MLSQLNDQPFGIPLSFPQHRQPDFQWRMLLDSFVEEVAMSNKVFKKLF
jgi:hypothetical protein